jgi:hypothetical protein
MHQPKESTQEKSIDQYPQQPDFAAIMYYIDAR